MKKTNYDIPVEKNQTIELTIDDLGIHGEGIGHYQGYTLFIDGGLIGEEVEVKVVKAGKKSGFGKLLHIIKPSPDRVEPICSVAKTCGGCQLQHMSYSAQLAYKKRMVESAIKRIGRIEDVEVKDVVGMEDPYHYRNKVIYPVREGSGATRIGFYAKRTHRVIEHKTCYIQDPKVEAIIAMFKEWMMVNDIQPYNEETGKGMIRNLMIRYSKSLDKCHLTIVSNKKKLKHLELLIDDLAKIGYIDGISFNVNIGKDNVIMGDKVINLWGKEQLEERLGEQTYMISPKAFFQVNPVQTKVLYDTVLEMADFKGHETVMDLYCGLGSIGLYMAKHVKKVIGVEVVEASIEDASYNAELNGIENIDFYIGKAEEVIPHLYETQEMTADVVIVDPPRKGCDEALLKTIVEMAPEKMIYVSCDPGTLSRDLRFLTENGFKVEKIQPIDMFPMTVHVESCVLLTKTK